VVSSSKLEKKIIGGSRSFTNKKDPHFAGLFFDTLA